MLHPDLDMIRQRIKGDVEVSCGKYLHKG